MLETQLAELFMQTGKDHHLAFIETDGEDPDPTSIIASRVTLNGRGSTRSSSSTVLTRLPTTR